jgi:hypothetical protein
VGLGFPACNPLTGRVGGHEFRRNAMSVRRHRARRGPTADTDPIPRAGIDPFRSLGDVLALIEPMLPHVLRPQVIVVFLDDQRRGINAAVIDDIEHDDVVIEVATLMALSLGTGGGLVLASVRPDHGVVADDEHRLRLMQRLVADEGVALHDWIVWGPSGPSLPRAVAGLPDPWADAA